MGAIRGSISYALYYVEGAPEDTQRNDWLDRIREFQFQPLEPSAEDDQSMGWCVVDRMLDLDFTPERVFNGPYLSLGLRVDRWSLPGALLKALIEERCEALMAQKQKLRLSRSERELVREVVVRELKERLLPAASLVDMVWNLDSGQVRFWTQSNARCELFEELFESTFGVRLVRAGAYTHAMNAQLPEECVGHLVDLEQSRFTDFA